MAQAFRYRRYEIEDDVYLVVRCELDATFETKDGGRAYITTKALNEFDPAISGVNWRQKLESQRAAVLANELKNNRNKLARWTVQAMLAGADYMKMGYVSRAHAKDNVHHFVLGTTLLRPSEFANQVCLCLCHSRCLRALIVATAGMRKRRCGAMLPYVCAGVAIVPWHVLRTRGEGGEAVLSRRRRDAMQCCVCQQIELKTENMWGICKAVMKRLQSLPVKEGDPMCKFLLLKVCEHARMRMCAVVLPAFAAVAVVMV